VISGFLITSYSLQRWGSLANINIRTFYVYRFARIFPALLVALFTIVLLGCFGLPYFSNTDGNHNFPVTYFVVAAGSVLTFWHNLLMQYVGYFNYSLNIYWSLSVEEVFYVALPLLCIGLKRTYLFVLVCVVLIVLGPIYRSLHTSNEIDYMYGYLACFDAISLGCLTALIAYGRTFPLHVAKPVRWLGILFLTLSYLYGISGNEVFGFTYVAVSSAFILFGSANAQLGKFSRFITKPVQWFGKHSYELYLFHIIVLALLRNLFPQNTMGLLGWTLLFVTFSGLSTLTAWWVARYVSDPLNRRIRQGKYR
jgi:peptidoglycan/LPS O-acetylase OafA/YrhL